MLPQSLRDDLRKLALTFGLALATGYGFLKLGLPAPYLMGSLFGVWFCGGVSPRLRPHLGVARWFHIPVVLGLGVLIGGYFTADLLDQAWQWGATLTAMIGVTVVVSAGGYFYLTRLRQYPPAMALLCSVPGGQAEAIVMARELVEKDFVVAFFHLVRLAIVFGTTPLLLGYLQGGEAVQASNAKLEAMPGLMELSPVVLFHFVAISLGGYGLARLARVPLPHLFGPMLLSIVLHAAGLAEVPRVQEFVMLAQLAIGGAVGARLAQVDFVELMSYLKDAVINTIVIVSLYFLAAMVMASVLGVDLLKVWLAFVPGGLYEVTLLALIFGFDIAFVAFHHICRVILIFMFLPFVAFSLGRDD